MEAFFGLLGFAIIIGSIIMLVVKAIRKQPKKKSLIALGVGFVFFVGALGAGSGSSTKPATTPVAKSTTSTDDKVNADQAAKDKAAADAKKKAEEEKAKQEGEALAKAAEDKAKAAEAQAKAEQESQAKAAAEAQAKADEEAKNPNWNTNDMYVNTNGNVPLAIKLLKATGDITKTATAPAPIAVQKAPWNYYGKPVKLTGRVGVVQDYPPGNELSVAMGGTSSEMVMVTNDGAFVDTLLSVSSGSVKVGDSVTVFGYPVGLAEVNNKMGGKTTQLVLVGNTYGIN